MTLPSALRRPQFRANESAMTFARCLLAVLVVLNWAGAAVAGPAGWTSLSATGDIGAPGDRGALNLAPDRRQPAAAAPRLHPSAKSRAGIQPDDTPFAIQAPAGLGYGYRPAWPAAVPSWRLAAAHAPYAARGPPARA